VAENVIKLHFMWKDPVHASFGPQLGAKKFNEMENLCRVNSVLLFLQANVPQTAGTRPHNGLSNIRCLDTAQKWGTFFGTNFRAPP
jgi:cytochrome c